MVLDEDFRTLSSSSTAVPERPKVLILDVRTRWSSTHAMLGKSCLTWAVNLTHSHVTERALLFRKAVDRYAVVSRLTDLELSSDDWAAIEVVAKWLKLFRTATTLMSSTKESTLSWATTIFLRLQDHIHDQLEALPPHSPALLKKGLVDAHVKLSTYHRLLDRSPYYLWASSMFKLASLALIC
jgi:hypothetical protein